MNNDSKDNELGGLVDKFKEDLEVIDFKQESIDSDQQFKKLQKELEAQQKQIEKILKNEKQSLKTNVEEPSTSQKLKLGMSKDPSSFEICALRQE